MTSDRGSFAVRAIGVVESPIDEPSAAPLQADEGAPPAWLSMDASCRDALADIAVGDRMTIVTWLHLARRDVLVTHPRGDRSVPKRGVFSTRSEDRPNPIGLHHVTVIAIDGLRLQVDRLEVIDGTPILDLKPTL